MSLEEQGWCFVLRAGLFSWLHPADAKEGDVDCTDMADDEFETLVKETMEKKTEALELLQQAFDAMEATSDSDLDYFEDEEEEAEAVPMQYACRKIVQAMEMLKGARGDLHEVVAQILDAGHMNTEDLARLRAAHERS